MKKTYSPMQFITQNAIIIVPLFPMAVVALAAFVFSLRAGIHWLLALLIAAVAAIAIELAGISAFRTLTSVYQSFKSRRLDWFIIVEFILLLVGVVVYLSALGLSAAVIEQEFPGSWPLGAMAGLLAVAVYIVRAVGETYQAAEREIEQDRTFERRQRQVKLEQQTREAEHRRKLELKQANIQTYDARTKLEQAKATPPNTTKHPSRTRPRTASRTPTRTTSNSLEHPPEHGPEHPTEHGIEHQLEAPPGTSRTFRRTFGQRQTEQNRGARTERLEQLLSLLSEHPDIGQNEAARTLGVSHSTCSDYVRELKSTGRLSRNGNGWHVKTPPSGGMGGRQTP